MSTNSGRPYFDRAKSICGSWGVLSAIVFTGIKQRSNPCEESRPSCPAIQNDFQKPSINSQYLYPNVRNFVRRFNDDSMKIMQAFGEGVLQSQIATTISDK